MLRFATVVILCLAVLVLGMVVGARLLAQSTPPQMARWSGTFRCTEIVVNGTGAASPNTQRMLQCTGSMVPPECPADSTLSRPGFCYEPADGSIRFRDGSGAWKN